MDREAEISPCSSGAFLLATLTTNLTTNNLHTGRKSGHLWKESITITSILPTDYVVFGEFLTPPD